MSAFGDNDRFIYNAASESTGVAHDIIDSLTHLPLNPETGRAPINDTIDVPFTVNAIDAAVSHSLSTATFDSDMAIIAANLGAHDAIAFQPSGGDYGTHGFIVVDFNGVAGYQAGQDLVIELVSGVASLTTDYFT